MDDLPQIERLVWDEWNLEHIAKHGITQGDVEGVLKGPALARRSYKNRFLVIGPTTNGRVLAVVIGADPHDPGSYYVFSARPASRRERRHYQQHRGGTEQ
jgi:uncharacterized DUF497 family protein